MDYLAWHGLTAAAGSCGALHEGLCNACLAPSALKHACAPAARRPQAPAQLAHIAVQASATGYCPSPSNVTPRYAAGQAEMA